MLNNTKMKRILIICLSLGVLALISCKKERSCECANGVKYTIEASKKDAKDACDVYGATNGGSCEIKD